METNRAQRRAAARRKNRCTVCGAAVLMVRLQRHMLRHGITLSDDDIKQLLDGAVTV